MNSGDYGWELDELTDRSKLEELNKRFNWSKLRNKIQGYIKSINFGYIANFNKVNDMEYLNCLATFKDQNTIICSKDTKLIK